LAIIVGEEGQNDGSKIDIVCERNEDFAETSKRIEARLNILKIFVRVDRGLIKMSGSKRSLARTTGWTPVSHALSDKLWRRIDHISTFPTIGRYWRGQILEPKANGIVDNL
jgi:hypothetical protein